MGERRMLSRKITDHDNFISLSASAQSLYMHLVLSADDEGFCNQVSLAMFKAHAGTQDLEALIDKHYLMKFDSGVLLIKHWKINNSIRKDRFTPSNYLDEKSQIVEKSNGVYTWLPSGCQMVAERLSDGCINKDRINKYNISSCSKGGKVNLLNMMTEDEISALFSTYEDADYLIDEVEADINRKLKGGEIYDAFRYVIGYATKKGWPEQEGQ